METQSCEGGRRSCGVSPGRTRADWPAASILVLFGMLGSIGPHEACCAGLRWRWGRLDTAGRDGGVGDWLAKPRAAAADAARGTARGRLVYGSGQSAVARRQRRGAIGAQLRGLSVLRA